MADSAANEAVRVAAARELLDRGFGRPTLPIAGDGEAPLVQHISFSWAPASEPEPGAPVIDATTTDELARSGAPLVLAWQNED
jgi:hypothetical protein